MGFGIEWGHLLFEVPVYRISKAAWHNEVNESVQQFEQSSSHTDPIKRHDHALALAALDRGYQSPTYNQVIAWLRLVWDGPGPVVKGYAYRVPQQRIVRNFKTGRFNWRGKVLEVWFTRDDTSKEIAGEIRKSIVDTSKKGNIFYLRYIDLEAFDSLAPHLDWRNLLGLKEG
jgi:hypothetical protein